MNWRVASVLLGWVAFGCGGDDSAGNTDGGSAIDASGGGGIDAAAVDGGISDGLERVSVGTGNVEAEAGSDVSVLSNDGRYVLFVSRAENLSAGKSQGGDDLFLRDRVTDTTTLVSADDNGDAVAAGFEVLSMSDDNNFVAFLTGYNRLEPGGSNSRGGFLRNISAGTTSIVSLTNGGDNVNGSLDDLRLSGDGNYVVFSSDGINLADANGSNKVYVRDLVNNTTSHVTIIDGNPVNGGCIDPRISDDGARILFRSLATNLFPTPYQGHQVFVTDRVAGTPTMVSIDPMGNPSNSIVTAATLSGNGRYVAFVTSATNLVTGVDTDTPHAYLRDLMTGTTIVASVSDTGAVVGGVGSNIAISDDGRYVAFETNEAASAGDMNARTDVYRFDRMSNTSTRASLDSAGGEPTLSSLNPGISGDGLVVTFSTPSPAMVPEKTSLEEDIYAVALP